MKKAVLFTILGIFLLAGISSLIIAEENNQTIANDKYSTGLTIPDEIKAYWVAVDDVNENCSSIGNISRNGTYNENSKTWWFDLTPFEERTGCNPACVVNLETEEVKVNWMCTGARNLICCESYGWGANMEKCCESYEWITKEKCTTPEGFTGGGKQIVDNSYCETNRVCCEISMLTSTGTSKRYGWAAPGKCTTPEGFTGGSKQIVDNSYCETEVEKGNKGNETEINNEVPANLICCNMTFTGEKGFSMSKYRFMKKEGCTSHEKYPKVSFEIINRQYCRQEIQDRFEHMKKVRKEKNKLNKLRAHVAAYLNSSECPENCTCAGSTIKCELNGERQMTVVAGNSGNIIIQVKGINASTNVTIYKSEGKLYGVFKGNQTRVILGPDQVREKIKKRMRARLEQENITLDDEGVYQVRAKKKARLFLIIPVREHIMSHVDAETGEIIKMRNPWWGFLARDIKPEVQDCAQSDNKTLCCQDKGYDDWNSTSEECYLSSTE